MNMRKLLFDRQRDRVEKTKKAHFPLPPEFALNGGAVCGSPEILVKGFLRERKPGIRGVYLNFGGIGFGWGSLVGWVYKPLGRSLQPIGPRLP
jgi:hypothetical protein